MPRILLFPVCSPNGSLFPPGLPSYVVRHCLLAHLTPSPGGENISSVALEGLLVEHPSILEAGVVAVPDSHWGERPKAYITVREPVTGEAIIQWAKRPGSAISGFMVPREIEVVDELPKTSTGKIKKNVLREWAKHGRGDGDR